MSREARRWTVLPPCLLLAALVVIFAFPQRGSAQVLYGSILGDVKDATGASIRGATVVAVNKSTGLARQGITDGTGRFNFPDLPAGVYNLKASQQGFKTFERTEVTVNINSVTRIDVTLQIGSMGDSVTVSTEPPKLQTDST
jgi:carboxypeptidase family protein